MQPPVHSDGGTVQHGGQVGKGASRIVASTPCTMRGPYIELIPPMSVPSTLRNAVLPSYRPFQSYVQAPCEGKVQIVWNLSIATHPKLSSSHRCASMLSTLTRARSRSAAGWAIIRPKKWTQIQPIRVCSLSGTRATKTGMGSIIKQRLLAQE